MLVDDNEMFRKGLQEVLEHSDDFTVIGQTGEGEEALDLAKRLRPDVILMDLLMPGKNGIDSCRGYSDRTPRCESADAERILEPSRFQQSGVRGSDGILAQAVGQGPSLECPARRSRGSLCGTLAVESPLALSAPDRFEASCVPGLRHTTGSRSGVSTAARSWATVVLTFSEKVLANWPA